MQNKIDKIISDKIKRSSFSDNQKVLLEEIFQSFNKHIEETHNDLANNYEVNLQKDDLVIANMLIKEDEINQYPGCYPIEIPTRKKTRDYYYETVYIESNLNKLAKWDQKEVKIEALSSKTDQWESKEVKIFRCEYYKELEKKVTEIYRLNSLDTPLLILPYLKRIFYIELPIDCKNWDVSDEYLEIKKELKPCWNIECVNVRDLASEEMREIPLGTNYRYELKFDIDTDKMLLQNAEDLDFQIILRNDKCVIRVDKYLRREWSFLRFYDIDKMDFGNIVFSNKRTPSKVSYNRRARTKSELVASINSTDILRNSGVILKNYEIKKHDKRVKLIFSNLLDHDEFFTIEKALLILKFKVIDKNIFTDDLIQLAVNKAQLFFPEYQCCGVSE